MNTFGLIDMSFPLIREVFEAGVFNRKSLTKTQNYRRYKQLAASFNFVVEGANTTDWSANRQITVTNYVEQSLETGLDRDAQGGPRTSRAWRVKSRRSDGARAAFFHVIVEYWRASKKRSSTRLKSLIFRIRGSCRLQRYV
jgi:hypothetical protein